MTGIDWQIEGIEFGNCNCDYSCLCQFEAKPTHRQCRGFEVRGGIAVVVEHSRRPPEIDRSRHKPGPSTRYLQGLTFDGQTSINEEGHKEKMQLSRFCRWHFSRRTLRVSDILLDGSRSVE